jgi:hypothetical protein
MRALVICWAWPANRGFRSQGVDQRLGLFLGAIARLCTRIDMLHVVPEGAISVIGDLDRIAREQSEHWNRDVSVTLIPRRDPPRRRPGTNMVPASCIRSHSRRCTLLHQPSWPEQWPIAPRVGSTARCSSSSLAATGFANIVTAS